MEETAFKILDRYGPSMVVIVFGVLLVWKIAPKLVEVWVEKIKAETKAIEHTGEAVRTTIPAVLGEIKTAHVSGLQEVKTALVGAEGRIITAVHGAVGADTDRRIEDRLSKIEHRVSRGSIPDSDAPPAPKSKQPARSDR